MKHIALGVLVFVTLFVGSAQSQTLDLTYCLTSPLADSDVAGGDPEVFGLEPGLSGLAVSVGFGPEPILRGGLTYVFHGFYRTADSLVSSYTEGAVGVGVRSVVTQLGSAAFEVGGLAAYSRYWVDSEASARDGAASFGGGYWVAPEVRASLPVGARFRALGLARAMVYLDQPDPNGLEFPFESGLVLSVGGAWRF